MSVCEAAKGTGTGQAPLLPSLIVLIKAIARDRLSLAPRTRLQVTPDGMQSAPHNPTVVARRVVEIVGTGTIGNPVILLAIDRKALRCHPWLYLAVPSRLFGIP